MTLSTPKSELTSARRFDKKSDAELAYWLDFDAVAMDGQPGRNNHVAAVRAAAERLLARAHTDREIRCPKCGGLNGAHGMVHTRYENGGGGNSPCPNRGNGSAER